MGEKGAYLSKDGTSCLIPAQKVQVVTVAAGDCFCGVIASARIKGKNIAATQREFSIVISIEIRNYQSLTLKKGLHINATIIEITNRDMTHVSVPVNFDARSG